MAVEKSYQLSHGGVIPSIGLGVWKMQQGGEVERSVLWALQAGYAMIDTASRYKNEAGVGAAIRQSGLARENVFVTTKLWNDDQGYEPALRAIDDSLSRLQLEYVDLYLVHWPFYGMDESVNKRQETWKAMEQILHSGKARAIGVSNYAIRHLEEMKSYASIMPAVNQIEMHPFLYQPDLLSYCADNNIRVEAYSPLMHGGRLNDERITAIASRYGKSNAQLLIRWGLQHGAVIIPKSTNQQRIRENIDVFDFEISDSDMQALNDLNENIHGRTNINNIP